MSESNDMPVSELWLALTKIPSPHKLVDIPRNFPGTTTPIGQVAIWSLSQEEQMACNAEADRFTKKLLQDPQKRDDANLGYQHTYTNEVAVQILSRVCRDPSNLEKAAFPSPKQMRQHLTADEVGVMFSQYLIVQLELGPMATDLSDEEMEAWLRRIAAEGSAFPFASLSPDMQGRLVLFAAQRFAPPADASTDASAETEPS